MKNVRENLKKTVLAIMVAMIALNFGPFRTFAEEPEIEPATEEVISQEENEEIVEAAAETEDMNNAMVLADNYTLMMGFFPLASLLVA